jgi:nucleoside-diphosphate-sugar epimerase
MKEKILVTGASGFVGRYVVGELVNRGYAVVASSADPIKAAQQAWFGQVTYIPFDLARQDSAPDPFSLFGRPDRLIHLAWEGLPNYKDAFHIEVNEPRHAAFLERMIRGGLRDLTVIGTCLEYGMQEGMLSEEMAAHPANPYAQAKDMLRRRLSELQAKEIFQFRWVRLFYMYGKGQNLKSLLSQLDKALEEGAPVFNLSGGEQVRDYLPIETVASYIVQIALQDRVTGIINCCSGKPVRIKDFVREYLKRKGKDISLNFGYYPYPDYEPMRFWGDSSKLKTIVKDE